MKLFLNFIHILYICVTLIGIAKAFIPAEVLSGVLFKLEDRFSGNLGKVSDSYTHDEITREGLIQSVAYFFNEQPGGSSKINLTKLEAGEYYDLRRLYYDFYGKGLCNGDIPFYDVVQTIEAATSSVDFNSATKDLPMAHFDAERFMDSNARVQEYQRRVNYDVEYNAYDDARTQSGQILHTIQDFYSHSNWVEQGKTDVKSNIGQASFDAEQTSLNDPTVCDDGLDPANQKCTLVKEECGILASLFAKLVNAIGLGGSYVSCPLEYYDCKNNILLLDRLVSGYYSGQENAAGTEVNKPQGQKKCSHGGILDGSSFISAEGGINKDSGYTIFSPHATLHTAASKLAIAHTKKFFDDIRTDFGDAKFSKFLELEIDAATLSGFGNVPCSSTMVKLNYTILLFLLAINAIRRFF